MAEDKLEIINPPKGLKEKAGTGGPGIMDPKALEKGEEAIASLADSYLDSVVDDLRNIDEAFKKLEAATGDRKEEQSWGFSRRPSSSRANPEKFWVRSDDDDWQRTLPITSRNWTRPVQKEVEAIKLHIDSLKLVISNDIKGSGGDVGEKMLAGLQQVCDKLLA